MCDLSTSQQTKISQLPGYLTRRGSPQHQSPQDLASHNSSYYDLRAVPTHQGRSGSSSHYVGWVKRKEDSNGNLCGDPVRRRLTLEVWPGSRVEDVKTSISALRGIPQAH
ncbi:ubiquitin carboxyl-terminal hydrolase 14-like isoform X1 [Tachysurus fulvidraco]|uniref:ubiquitin carboxyl-terminal hydrolase 14-like isoform X1 n=1 Tax=Tachysurus fulvidraco TaxID=1234273 RepID=UPI001FEE4687|nr:ubiquitin carboxyl-terminal hydrolase 14-like isoform X1 [Tachysurus fulvidraco]